MSKREWEAASISGNNR